MEKTLDQLKADAQAAQEAFDNAERARLQAIRVAERAEKIAKENERILAAREALRPAAESLIKAMTDAGYTNVRYSWQTDRMNICPLVTFAEETHITRIRFELAGSAFLYRVSGKMKITIGGYGGRTFPQKKDGSFSYDKIVAAVKEIETADAARRQRESEKANRLQVNEKIVERIRQAFPREAMSWSTVRPAAFDDNKVALELKYTVTEADAMRIFKAIQDLKLGEKS